MPLLVEGNELAPPTKDILNRNHVASRLAADRREAYIQPPLQLLVLGDSQNLVEFRWDLHWTHDLDPCSEIPG